jgi:hypothetical protein
VETGVKKTKRAKQIERKRAKASNDGANTKKPGCRNVRYGSPVISIQFASFSPRLKSNPLSERRQQPERQRRA